MALDVYVGPLTRYYMGDWESTVKGAGRGGRPRRRIARAQDSQVVLAEVLSWRERLRASLTGTLAFVTFFTPQAQKV